jgi:hypothetical protein
MRITLVGTLVALCLAGASPAHADEMRSLPLTSLQPADGLSVVADDYPLAKDEQMLDFVVDTPFASPKPSQLVLEVASQNIPGQDGTLANDFQEDYNVIYPSDAFPTVYKFRTAYYDAWLGTPGVHYWQIYATVYDFSSGCDPCHYTTPTRTITVMPRPTPAAPVPAPATQQPTTQQPTTEPPIQQPTSTAKRYVLYLGVAVRRAKAYIKSHRNARNPTAKCRKVSSGNAVCTVRWKSRGHRRSARLDVIHDKYGYTVQPR